MTFGRSLALACLAGGLALVAFRLATGIQLEDAWITWRFAENLALGHGYAFNPGEPIQGTTTPLHTLILAGVAWVAGPRAVPAAAAAMGVVAGVLAAAFAGLGLRAVGVRDVVAALTALALLVHPSSLWSFTGGMETPLVVLFLTASWWAAVTGRGVLAGALVALLVLTRVDGVVWAGLLALAVGARSPRGLLGGLAVGVAILAPWTALATAWFGTFVPHSVTAKAAILPLRYRYDVLDPAALLDFLPWGGRVLGGLLPGAPALGALLTVAGAVVALRHQRAAVRILPLFLVLFPASFYFGQAPRFPWYLVPGVACGVLVGGLAANALLDRFGGRAGAALLALAVVTTARADLLDLRDHTRHQANEDGTRRRVGEWLAAHTSADATVAMEAIGYQGAFARRRVIDLAGLISPEVVALARTDDGSRRQPAEVFEAVVHHLEPDYIVLRAYEVDEDRHQHGGPLFTSPAARRAFFSAYAPVARFDAPHPEAWGENAHLVVWERLRH